MKNQFTYKEISILEGLVRRRLNNEENRIRPDRAESTSPEKLQMRKAYIDELIVLSEKLEEMRLAV